MQVKVQTPINTPAEYSTLAYWLIGCVILVFAMIVIGGITRLTGSGLSIVDWNPIIGIIPPLSEQSWQEAFARYQQFPEYEKVNFAMSLDEFRVIFWIEYLHRLVGRLIGIALLVPTIYCLVKPCLRIFLSRIAIVWILGGLQGAMGWYMVKSGLINNPWVSPYRLTAHLLLAVVIIGYLLWTIFQLRTPKRTIYNYGLKPHIMLILAMIITTIIMGGFTAGLHAGLIYNTFPYMNGSLIPAELLDLKPMWRNLFENPTTVQFAHRTVAIATVVLIAMLAVKTRQAPIRRSVSLLAIAALVQFGLGISTLVMKVPITLAVLHQAWAIIVFGVGLWCLYQLGVVEVIHPPPSTRSLS